MLTWLPAMFSLVIVFETSFLWCLSKFSFLGHQLPPLPMGERRSAVPQCAVPWPYSFSPSELPVSSSWHTPLICALSHPEHTSGPALIPEGSWLGVEACVLRNPSLALLFHPAVAFGTK